MYDDDDEYSVDVYDTNEGGILNLIEGGGEQETIGPVSDVAFSPDGTNIVLAAESVVHLCDIASESYIRSFKGHSSDVWSVTFSPDGTKVASGSYGKVKLWDAVGCDEWGVSGAESCEQCVVFWRGVGGVDGTVIL